MPSIALFANNAASSLALSINAGATVAQVAAGTGALFPNPTGGNYFIGTFTDAQTGAFNEIVKVTGRSGDVLTIIRGQDGTSARAWSAGDNFEMFWTAGEAGVMLQANQAQQQSPNYGENTGTSDALIVTLDPAPTSYADIVGAPVRVLLDASNTTTTPTLNVNGLGVRNITMLNGAEVPAGTLAIGMIAEFIYLGSSFQYNGQVIVATKEQLQAGTAGAMPVTPAALFSAYPFTASGSTLGRIYLPGGVLFQWGNYNTPSASPVSIVFPVAFTSLSNVTFSQTQSPGSLPSSPAVLSGSAFSITGFTLYSCIWDGAAFINNSGTSFHWHAIGLAALP